MDARIKNLWIDRLENGNSPQTQNKLGKCDGSRCCLGVLCDIAVEEGVIGSRLLVGEDRVGYDNYETSVLPEKVKDWAVMSSRNGSYDDGAECLASDNDAGRSFAEIAQTIREKF